MYHTLDQVKDIIFIRSMLLLRLRLLCNAIMFTSIIQHKSKFEICTSAIKNVTIQQYVSIVVILVSSFV